MYGQGMQRRHQTEDEKIESEFMEKREMSIQESAERVLSTLLLKKN